MTFLSCRPFLVVALLQPIAPCIDAASLLEINHDSLKSFFDDAVPRLLNQTKGVGMAISVVKKPDEDHIDDDGAVVFQKGYGYANLEKGIQVHSHETLFRPGSISKLFVWASVMQLVEKGKLDLDTDVNLYLDIKIPETYPDQPITMRHLMSHTGGFVEYLFNLFVKDPQKVMSLRDVIQKQMPPRKRPPGIEIEYSNFGAMLAGYIVEVISGMPFEAYVEQHIFSPLNMTRSTFRQHPFPDDLHPFLSQGYGYDGSEVHPREFEFVQGSPAGGMSASVTDISQFLGAHLPDASNGLLQPSTLTQMHSTLHRSHPAINGMAHGFLEMDSHGQRVVGHGGDTIYFHSVAGIFLERNLVFCFALNTGAEGGIPKMPVVELYLEFLDHYFGHDAPTGRNLAATGDASSTNNGPAHYVGNYLANRRSEHEFLKISSLFMNLKVEASTDEDSKGMIRVFNIFSHEMDSYVEIGPGLFQQADGYGKVAFLYGNDDRKSDKPKSATFYLLPIMIFHRPPIWEEPVANAAIAGVSLLLILLGAFAPPIGLLTRFFVDRKDSSRGQTSASWLAFFVVMIYFGFFASVYMAMDPDFIFAGVPPLWPFTIPWVAFAAGIALPYHAYFAWKERYWGFKSRTFYTVFAVFMQLWFWFLWYWKVAAEGMGLQQLLESNTMTNVQEL